MTDFYIFRHGDTTESGSIFFKFLRHSRDSHNLDILPKATPALKKIGEFLKNIPTDANFSSPYKRCLQSTKIVSAISNKEFISDIRLHELESAEESFQSLFGRVKSFLNDVDKNNYSSVSICTHGAVIAAIKHILLKGKFYPFQIFDYPAPGNLIIIKNKKMTKIDFNSNA